MRPRSAWINALLNFIPALMCLTLAYSVWRDPRPPELIYVFGGLTLGWGMFGLSWLVQRRWWCYLTGIGILIIGGVVVMALLPLGA